MCLVKWPIVGFFLYMFSEVVHCGVFSVHVSSEVIYCGGFSVHF